MIPDLLFYKLLLLASVLLCVMLHLFCPAERAAARPTPPQPAPPPRPRSEEPKPFAGLTRKPHCDACEQAPVVPPLLPPPAPPPMVIHTRGCPLQVDASAQFCPNPDCAYYGRAGYGNLHANGHPNGRPWRQWHCGPCGAYFLETYGTPFHGKRVSPDLLVWAVGALAEGLGIRAVARVVFGTKAAVEQVLAACGWQINTAFIERVNLSIRQHVAAVGRRVMTLCKGEDGLRQQLALYHAYYNFCLPHASLRQPLAQPEPTNGNGSAKRWQPRTPAMAAGLTDHVWTLREVLLFRVPPWPQPQAV